MKSFKKAISCLWVIFMMESIQAYHLNGRWIQVDTEDWEQQKLWLGYNTTFMSALGSFFFNNHKVGEYFDWATGFPDIGNCTILLKYYRYEDFGMDREYTTIFLKNSSTLPIDEDYAFEIKYLEERNKKIEICNLNMTSDIKEWSTVNFEYQFYGNRTCNDIRDSNKA